MNKKQYIEELKRLLSESGVKEIEDVISDYEDHFDFKSEEGQSEEETVRKLPSPQEVAKEYSGEKSAEKPSGKGVVTAGLVFMGIPASLLYIVLWASVAVLGAFSLVCTATGVCLIAGLNVENLIPNMPYICAAITGIAFLGLSVVAAVGSVYLFLYVKQWGKAYLRWCKNLTGNRPLPSVSKHPKISKKFSHVLKLVLIIALIVFIVAFATGYLSMCLSADSAEPWHVWNWFM